jgi:hypothetical protein
MDASVNIKQKLSVMRTLFTPFILGAVAPILIYRTLGFEGKNLTQELIFVAIIFGVFSMGSCMILPYQVREVIIFLYIGIAVGIVIDSTIDLYFFHRDRNLFPFEILYIWIIAALPVIVGSVLGCWFGLHVNRTKKTD